MDPALNLQGGFKPWYGEGDKKSPKPWTSGCMQSRAAISQGLAAEGKGHAA